MDRYFYKLFIKSYVSAYSLILCLFSYSLFINIYSFICYDIFNFILIRLEFNISTSTIIEKNRLKIENEVDLTT